MEDSKLLALIAAKQQIARMEAEHDEALAFLNATEKDNSLKNKWNSQFCIYGHQAFEYYMSLHNQTAEFIDKVKNIELTVTAVSVHSYLLNKDYVYTRGKRKIYSFACSVQALILAFDEMIQLRIKYFNNFLNINKKQDEN